MKKNELRAIYSALYHAKEVIENLTAPQYPYGGFYNAEFESMFYAINQMCIQVSDMQDAAKN